MNKLDEMKKFTVDRRYWNRGRFGYGPLELLNEARNKCCLGFLASACGVENEDMLNIAVPSSCDLGPLVAFPKFLFEGCMFMVNLDDIHEAKIENFIAFINDNDKIEDWEREIILEYEFREHGIEVEFIN